MSHAPDQKPLRRHKTYFKVLRPEVAVAGAAGLWSMPDLCKAYDWPKNLAGGGVIGLVQLGGGWVQSDIDAYFNSIRQPIPQIADVSVDGTVNDPNQNLTGGPNDPDIEVAVDIQVAGAAYSIATGKAAVLRIYWTRNIAIAVQRAAADGCDVCSISWGGDEALWGRPDIEKMEAVAAAATAQGMIVFAASGDNDSSDGGPSAANVDAPASCPHVIGCGGTTKTATSETVWNTYPGTTDGEGTGGGYSTVFPIQAFQIGAPPAPPGTPFGAGRMVPDVAANADPATGYSIYVHGAPNAASGTSAVAPLYAGLFASFGKKLGFVTPRLWQNQGAFNDITIGDNGLYDAGPGPDPCSGLGSPIGTRIAALFVTP